MPYWDYRRQILIAVIVGAAAGGALLLIKGASVTVSLLVGVPVGAYIGLLIYGRELTVTGRNRPARRWNPHTKQYDRRLSAFDWLVVATALVPAFFIICILVALLIQRLVA